MSETPGDYKVGDWVRVVKGAWAAKGESKFSEPLEVRKVYRYAMLLSDGNVWNRGKVVRVPVGGNREKLPDMGNKSGNNVDDNTCTSETPLSKREHEGVKKRGCVVFRWFCSVRRTIGILACRREERKQWRRKRSAEEAAAVAVSPSRLSEI
ncbi:hypothetical protein NDU88_001514 [Pleurodeles waltl]|uniref:Uncharacterized protein n=1 Tax=Pleurodeles waltl TaxID=8319 RepID=A0AAV7LBI9_PLEWA|nr:hypothetical protein NDU88_001514 [Pleurodeles waltl]